MAKFRVVTKESVKIADEAGKYLVVSNHYSRFFVSLLLLQTLPTCLGEDFMSCATHWCRGINVNLKSGFSFRQLPSLLAFSEIRKVEIFLACVPAFVCSELSLA